MEEQSETVTADRERALQQQMDEQLQAMDVMKLEKEEVDRDRRQLLIWNQELQKRLDALNGQNGGGLSAEEIERMQSQFDEKKRISEHFEHQLLSLKKVMSRGNNVSFNEELEIMKDIKHSIEAIDEQEEKGKQVHAVAREAERDLASPGQAGGQEQGHQAQAER